jgi:hypothetical protein
MYIVEANGHFKIGVATNIKKRISSLQTSCPFKLSLLKTWQHDDALDLERLLHKKYKSFRCSGEWFKLSAKHIQVILGANKIEDLCATKRNRRISRKTGSPSAALG